MRAQWEPASSSRRAIEPYAVDGNADGRRDLWGNWEDIFGSVANYFKIARLANRRAGHRAGDASRGCERRDACEQHGSQRQDRRAGASRLRVLDCAAESAPATVLGLEGYDGTEYWVGFHNFFVITRYNRSVMYALAVKQLADAIVAEARRVAAAETTADSGDEA